LVKLNTDIGAKQTRPEIFYNQGSNHAENETNQDTRNLGRPSSAAATADNLSGPLILIVFRLGFFCAFASFVLGHFPAQKN